MAEAVVSSAVQTIGNLLVEEARFLHGVGDQVEQLQLELSRMQAFLKDADAKQRDEEMVKVWISQARALAYEAEDLIESYAFKVVSGSGRDVKSIIKKCVCILNKCYVSHRVGNEIQTLKTKISDLTRSFQEYGIRSIMERGQGGSSSLEQELRRTYSHVAEDHFVGLVSDVELLVEHLVMENEINYFRVVSIYGMGGLGKTTLAQKVYNHPRVKRYFDGYVWVCVSQNWRKEDILQRILIGLIPERREEILKWRDDELVRQLFEIQQRKKYLLVLDDIWSTDAWECMKHAFPIRKDGSKILLTTRNKDVAEQIGPNSFQHQPRQLSDDESWELLKMKALRESYEREHEDIQKLEKLGKEMVKYCGGLPLAVIVLGGTLATKKTLNEWEAVHKNVKALFGRGNNLLLEQGNVLKILALSYDDLPHKLKPCFLYLSKFDEDSDIDAETLYQLWIAEGMISVKDRIGEESMMDVAERYLGELVQRCMVQGDAPDPEIPSILRYFVSCRIHDLMRDLSLVKAKEENFLLSISYDDGIDDDEIANNSSSFSHLQAYRLSISLSRKSMLKYVLPEKRMARHLRSLALKILDGYEGRMPDTMKSQFSKLKMLRVLAIEGFRLHTLPRRHGPIVFDIIGRLLVLAIDHLKLPISLGKLVHLKYLSIGDSIFICLPSSVGDLQHLQTLDLQGATIYRIPNVLWKLRQLRHLYLPHDYSALSCKLRLKGLNKLEILENFYVPTCHTKDIFKLKNLRVLSATVLLDTADPTEIIGYISNSNHLGRTYVTIFVKGDSAATTITAEKISTAVAQCFSCCNLHMLKIKGPIGKLPKYEAHFGPSLTVLTLWDSNLMEDPMETLEMLPNLRKLYLSFDSFVGKEIRCTALGFRRLRFLELRSLYNLEKWWIDEGAMPSLLLLTIDSCKRLEMIPNGLKFVTTLQELEIIEMPKTFTDRIRQEGADFDKISHIPSLLIRNRYNV
ncbi:hypothetical protein ACH5RR_007420 [Cinchona calisaya]|uniref:Disease resistance protein At1g50180 n=1 Tax=Cinchona calisaya TaxID=153742 RepID=A0ABD3AS75_9GENT